MTLSHRSLSSLVDIVTAADKYPKAFAIFEYMQTQEFITRFNQARDQVRHQLGNIETEFARSQVNGGFGAPLPGLQDWWDVVLGESLLFPPSELSLTAQQMTTSAAWRST